MLLTRRRRVTTTTAIRTQFPGTCRRRRRQIRSKTRAPAFGVQPAVGQEKSSKELPGWAPCVVGGGFDSERRGTCFIRKHWARATGAKKCRCSNLRECFGVQRGVCGSDANWRCTNNAAFHWRVADDKNVIFPTKKFSSVVLFRRSKSYLATVRLTRWQQMRWIWQDIIRSVREQGFARQWWIFGAFSLTIDERL